MSALGIQKGKFVLLTMHVDVLESPAASRQALLLLRYEIGMDRQDGVLLPGQKTAVPGRLVSMRKQFGDGFTIALSRLPMDTSRPGIASPASASLARKQGIDKSIRHDIIPP